MAVINSSTVLTDDDVLGAVAALQTQVHRDFAPAWGIDAEVVGVAKGKKPPVGSWWLAVLDDSDQAGALGYHDVTNEGLPLGKVFAGTDLALSAIRDLAPGSYTAQVQIEASDGRLATRTCRYRVR